MDIFKVLTRGTNIKSNSINKNYTKTTKKSSVEEDKELDFFHNQSKIQNSSKDHVEEEIIEDEDISMKDLLVKNHFNGKLIYNIDNHLLNVDKPTEIQSKSIKLSIERENADVVGISPTGTGKTLAFMIPLISKIIMNTNDSNMNSLQSIIIAPTNDLAKQIFQVTESIVQGIVLNHKQNSKSNCKLEAQLLNSKLSNKLLFENVSNLKMPQIIISTPKRLISVLNKENTDVILEHLKVFVIDEFDQLFSSDFSKQTEKLLSLLDDKQHVNKWMYSATKPEEKVFNNIIKKHMTKPELIECKYSSKLTSNIVKPKITESLVFVGNEQGKLLQLRQLQQNSQFIPPMLIFLESHSRCMALYNELKYNSIPMATLHSKMSLNEREKVINDFKEGKVWVIITTDIMARGLDINGIRTVINYDIPKNKELYIHRLGRVGRGLTSYNTKGNKKIECECITLYSKIDAKDVIPIAKVMKQHGAENIPDWLVEGRVRENKSKKDDKKLKREKISTVPGIIRKERRMKKEMIEASKKRKQEGIVRPEKKQKKISQS